MSKQLPRATEARLSDVTKSIQYGYTSKSSYQSKGPKYLRITDIQNDHVNWNQVPHVTVDSLDCKRYLLRGGDIVFARSGATVGKSFLIRDNPDDDAIFASYLIRVRCDSNLLDPQYAALFFKSMDYWKQISQGATGTGQPNFNGTKLGDLRIPVCDIKEQGRIVAKLDSLFGHSKIARDELARLPRLIERCREAVFAAASSGELTSDWRNSGISAEDGSALLRRILIGLSRQQKGGKLFPEAPHIPKTWVWCRVGDVGQVTLGRQRSPRHHSGTHMRPYLRVANVYENRIDTRDIMEMNFTPDEYERFKLTPGDILLNEGQSKELIGRPAMFMGEVEDVCFTNTLVRFRAYQPISAAYALIVFRHYFRSGLFRSIANITTNIAHLGAGRFADLPFPLPPLAEQAEIVKRCSVKIDAVEMVGAHASQALAQIERLEQATLAKAFRGELLECQQKHSQAVS